MTYTPLFYSGDGEQTDFSISWDYILSTHVEVYLNNVLQDSADYSFPSTGVLRFDSAPGVGVAIEIRRDTPASPILVEWADGAPILGSDLNKAIKQAIYSAEEATYERTVLLEWLGEWTSGFAYSVNDGVSLNGSSYICILGHTSSASDEPEVGGSWSTYWDVIASKGDTGASGAGSGDMLVSAYDPANINEQLVGLTATQTLTNKTLTAPTITSPALAAGSIDSITEIAAGLKTGADTKLVTGTAGTNTHLAQWNSDGDLVTAGKAVPSGDIVGTTDSQTLTNKTLSSPTITVGSDATGDIYYRTSGGVFQRLPAGSDGQVLTVASGLPSWAAGGGFTEHGAGNVDLVASQTSGAYTFTSIPSGVSVIRIIFFNVSPDATSNTFIVRVGDSGGIDTTGYNAHCFNWTANSGNFTTSFPLTAVTNAASNTLDGEVFLRKGGGTNTWFFQGNTMRTTLSDIALGNVAMGGVLDRVQLTWSAGANFDGSSSAVLFYE